MTMTETNVEHSMTLSNGNHLRYVTRGPTSSAAVVLVHGWLDSWRSFELVLDAMPPTVSVVGVSLRGFGGSDAPAHGYEISDFAGDVVELVERLGVKSAVYVGHSMGSRVVQRIAVERPDLVAGLVLIGGFARVEPAFVDEVWSVVSELTDPVNEDFVREFQAGTIEAPVSESFFEQVIAESMRAPALCGEMPLPAPSNQENAVGPSQIQAPTLLIWGDHDTLIPRAEQDRLVSIIPDSELVVYEGVGHCPNWEQPGRVAGDIDAFRSRLTA